MPQATMRWPDLTLSMLRRLQTTRPRWGQPTRARTDVPSKRRLRPYKLPENSASASAIGPDGTLYVASNDGTLTAFRR